MENSETGPVKDQINQNQNVQERIQLPNATAVLVLGIFSIVTSCCCGFIALVGLVLGIIALTLASKSLALYNENPGQYTETSFKNTNAGKICAIIGIVVSGVLILTGIIYLIVAGATLGTIFSTFPWENIIN
jgi:type IV secretory pathway VirB2 component (pilin)